MVGWTKNNQILPHLSLKTSEVLIRGIEAIYKVGGTQYNRYQFTMFFTKENWLIILFIWTMLNQYNENCCYTPGFAQYFSFWNSFNLLQHNKAFEMLRPIL